MSVSNLILLNYPLSAEEKFPIDKNFNYVKKYPKSIEKHRGDKTGKSIYTEITYKLKDGYIVITCYDYSIEDGGQDHLAVSIDTNELNEFLVSGVY